MRNGPVFGQLPGEFRAAAGVHTYSTAQSERGMDNGRGGSEGEWEGGSLGRGENGRKVDNFKCKLRIVFVCVSSLAVLSLPPVEGWCRDHWRAQIRLRKCRIETRLHFFSHPISTSLVFLQTSVNIPDFFSKILNPAKSLRLFKIYWRGTTTSDSGLFTLNQRSYSDIWLCFAWYKWWTF